MNQKIKKSKGVLQVRGDAHGNTVIFIDNSTNTRQSFTPGKVAVSDVLSALDQLEKPARIKVLDFMEREFDTRMVKELQDLQLLRTLKYVKAVLNSAG